ncbi:MAG: aspartate kinase [Bacteroidetes bacterium]|nr:aspartate kinase [Bacteroidota bacterium]
MKVFKFGGASVQSADAVKNIADILKKYGSGELVIVISAMGKVTNALEQVLDLWWDNKPYQEKIKEIQAYHFTIMDGLFAEKTDAVYDEIENYFIALEHYFEKELERNYDCIYDQVVSFGELISTKIISHYLNRIGYRNKWVDARHFIITDNLYREARIHWDTTVSLISRRVGEMVKEMPVVVQGFIGSTKDNSTTTLGREGSDYTASIFANALNADEMIIWKDVPGIMNADPKKYADAIMFENLSYQEAVEMTYYGARVLHPKTIKPIQNKNIPLNVRSFIHPDAKGTIITADAPIQKDVPIIILKEKQILISLSTKDYSFIAETNIEKIFDEVVRCGIKVNVMTNSAISFMICVDTMEQKIADFISSLENEFTITTTPNLELLSIKYYKENTLQELLKGRTTIMEQRSGDTVQLVIS